MENFKHVQNYNEQSCSRHLASVVNNSRPTLFQLYIYSLLQEANEANPRHVIQP